MTYQQQLEQDEWKNVAIRIAQRDKFICQQCKRKVRTFHCHHTVYDKRLLAWEAPPETLITLCPKCHTETHNKAEEANRTYVTPQFCVECGDAVDNTQGYGNTGRYYYCESCVNIMEIARGELI